MSLMTNSHAMLLMDLWNLSETMKEKHKGSRVSASVKRDVDVWVMCVPGIQVGKLWH
jgi:hypothetical protein